MKTIWKYELKITDFQAIENMPEGAQILHVGAQTINRNTGDGSIIKWDKLMIWALVNPDNQPCTRRFAVVGTDNPFPTEETQYIGTVQILGMVWHVFELMGGE